MGWWEGRGHGHKHHDAWAQHMVVGILPLVTHMVGIRERESISWCMGTTYGRGNFTTSY